MGSGVQTEEPGPGARDAPGAARASWADSPHAPPRPILDLGRGGMGQVQLALRAPGAEAGARQLVAVKRLLPELVSDPEKRELFFREARLACRLAHPNVVRALDYGEHAGEPFLVMDFVDGVPLDRLLQSGSQGAARSPLPRDLAAHVLACVAAGLHAAHELGDEHGEPLNLVHRDVSPHNVMISRQGDVLLLDFGVAKIDTQRGLTKTGEVRGKTAYMSPEQGLGDPLDRRSDLFALGALLFECVQGARMWGDGTELDVLRRLALEEAPRLPGDDALVALHARLVARAVDDRPATADEAARALAAYAETQAAEAGDSPDFRTRLAERVALVAGDGLTARAELIESALAGPTSEAPSARPPRHVSAAPPSAAPSPSARPATRLRTLLAAALVVALGGTIAVSASRARVAESAPPGATPTGPPIEPRAAVTPPSAGGPATTIAATPTSAPAAPASATAALKTASQTRPRTAPAPSAAASTSPSASARGAASAAASAPHRPPPTLPNGIPLDVDPTPF